MEDEKKLQETLIRRFILTLVVISMVEFILTAVSDRWIMPVIAGVFFPDNEISESFSTLALGVYIAGSLAGSLISFISSIFLILLNPIHIYFVF